MTSVLKGSVCTSARSRANVTSRTMLVIAKPAGRRKWAARTLDRPERPAGGLIVVRALARGAAEEQRRQHRREHRDPRDDERLGERPAHRRVEAGVVLLTADLEGNERGALGE